MKKKSNRSRVHIKRGILVIVLLVILAVISIFFGSTISGSFIATENRPEYCERDTVKLGSYLIQGKCIPKSVFAELPPYPKNINEIKLLVEYGKIRDLATIGEEYYKQPEFYQNWNPSGVNSFLNPLGGYFGAFGFGTYPADVVATLKPGQSLKVGTFFKTSWGVQTYQGIQLVSVFPEHAESRKDNYEIDQNPDLVRNYFDASITPNLFLLGPTFGVFNKDWIKLVNVIIKVKPDTPPGEYLVGVTPIAPPVEMQDKWLSQYGLSYVSAGETSIGSPFFQIFIEVQ